MTGEQEIVYESTQVPQGVELVGPERTAVRATYVERRAAAVAALRMAAAHEDAEADRLGAILAEDHAELDDIDAELFEIDEELSLLDKQIAIAEQEAQELQDSDPDGAARRLAANDDRHALRGFLSHWEGQTMRYANEIPLRSEPMSALRLREHWAGAAGARFRRKAEKDPLGERTEERLQTRLAAWVRDHPLASS